MTRQQVLRRQIIAVVVLVVVFAIIVAINFNLRTFAHTVKLGKIVEADFATGGPPSMRWRNPQWLAQIQAALPLRVVGAGYAPYIHTHQNLSVSLHDDKGKVLNLALPTDENSLVDMPSNPDFPHGDSWEAPKLLGVLGDLGVEAMKNMPPGALDPLLADQFKFWHERFGSGPKPAGA
jgi:hypothetical protein